MEPAVRPGTVVAPLTPAVAARIVPRRALFERLRQAERVTEVSAPAGSGKTLLLRSWIGADALATRTAWVTVDSAERDAQRFWMAVAAALARTTAGAAVIRAVTPAPERDGELIVEHLLQDLGALGERVWLVIDDAHLLQAPDLLRQLELSLSRAPGHVRIVLATRHDLRLGLHRLRVDGELTEIRAADLQFTLAESRALFERAGTALSDSALKLLHERTEGWSAGLRLAALSLAGHPDPERFAAEFSGSDRTVAEYLLAEVLDRQPEAVRRMLLRTALLGRVCGELANLLAGGTDGERLLQGLEEANAFVVSLDPRRTWFRYHHLFADLLQLELRRAEPGAIPALHRAAAGWLAEHRFPVEAIRHAQAAGDWPMAVRVLSDNWFELVLEGQHATAYDLLTGFPADLQATDGELAALRGSHELARGALDEAERYLTRAAQGADRVAEPRRARFEVALAVRRLYLAQQHGDLPAVVELAEGVLARLDHGDAAGLGLGDELKALTLIGLGTAQLWSLRLDEAERSLEQSMTMARRLTRPYLELRAAAHLAALATLRGTEPARAEERAMGAVDLARRHAWTAEPAAAVAYIALADALVWQLRVAEADRSLGYAERALPAHLPPATGMMVHVARGLVALARGRDGDALGAFAAAERPAGRLVPAHPLATDIRALTVHTLIRRGETDRAQQMLAGLSGSERDRPSVRTARAALCLALHDPGGAAAALAAPKPGSVPGIAPLCWDIQAYLIEAGARDALGDAPAAERALRRALDLAEPGRLILAFLLHPRPGLLDRHRAVGAAHPGLVAQIRAGTPAAAHDGPPPMPEPLSDGELRVLRYLPTHLSAPEIARELTLSVHTVKTHLRHIYAKLGTHRRAEAVERARALGLLSGSARRRA